MADFKIKSASGTGNKLLIKGQNQDVTDSSYAIQIGDSGASTLHNATITAGTFPTGHITNTFRFTNKTAGEYAADVDSSASKVPIDAVSWSAISGRHYHVISCCNVMPYANSNSSGRVQTTRLYAGTTNRSEGDTQASTGTDTILMEGIHGRNLVSATSSATGGYYCCMLQGEFTAASTETHYVYLTIHTGGSGPARVQSSATQPWIVIIYEIMS